MRIFLTSEYNKILCGINYTTFSTKGTDPVIYKRYKQHQKRNMVSLDLSPPYELWQMLGTNPLGLKHGM